MAVQTLDLSGTWKLKDYPHGEGKRDLPYDVNRTTTGWFNVEVPGDIHTTLTKVGRIPDPYFGANVQECQWTTEREWWFRREFTVPRKFLLQKTELVFDGIDTYGTVFFNGQQIGKTDNMFRQFRYDVTSLLVPGEKNVVTVRVGATMKILEEKPHKKYFACFNTPRIFARKAQCQFGWDWAPHLPGLGIWLPVRLETSDPGRVQSLSIRTRNDGTVTFHLELDEKVARQDLDQSKISQKGEDNLKRPTGEFRVTVKGHGYNKSHTFPVRGQKTFHTLEIPKPALWWPNGLGEPNLYDYRIELLRGGKVHYETSGRFGIREVELVEDPIPGDGFTFRFRINGIDTFCKGANWIPADSFPGTVTDEKYHHLLELARRGNFNMLRVWGGGIYERDLFYDLCDEKGIMVWQDFMFACSDYPDDHPEFIEQVIPELEYQVKRLRNHPCIMHWCGGNEKTGSAGFLVSYGERLFHIIARGVANDLDGTRSYRPASPQSYTDLGNDPDSGDSHGSCYEKAFEQGVEKFRSLIDNIRTVFNSEFGFHGPVRYRSLVKFIPSEDLWPPNDVWELHVQDNPYNTIPETFVQVQQKIAQTLFGEITDVRDFIRKGSTAHAEILRAEMEHHRRRKWTNAGAMFWMFSDCWPCGSWSVVDYFLNPKPVYYALKRAMEPLILSIHETGEDVEIHACNDQLSALKGELEYGQGRLAGPPLWHKTRAAVVAENDSTVLFRYPKARIESTPDSYLYARFKGKGVDIRTMYFHNLFRNLNWPDPGLEWKVTGKSRSKAGTSAELEIKTSLYARMVHVDTAEDVPVFVSDNFFDLMPGEKRKVTLESPGGFDVRKLRVHHWLDKDGF